MTRRPLPRCRCGATVTTQPLSACRPCDICGQMLHTQYALIYHPNCTLEPKLKPKLRLKKKGKSDGPEDPLT